MDWSLLGLSFVTIFLAELGDKSSLAIFALSSSSKYPRAIFFGALIALIAANLLGAIVGEELGDLLPVNLVKIAAALGFTYLALNLLWSEWRAHKSQKKSAEDLADEASSKLKNLFLQPYSSPWAIFGSTMLTTLLNSMGDQEQLATLLLSAQSRSPMIVFAGAVLGVMLASFLAVVLGQGIGRFVSPKILKTASGILLLLVAVWLMADLLHPGAEFELNFK
jgi:putative Ca2+/H+ antiporter (TMEM165/GDT1 family)